MPASWDNVAEVLLGRWPSQVASWGREAIAAYIHELQASDLTPSGAISSLRADTGQFPPAVGIVAKRARRMGCRTRTSLEGEARAIARAEMRTLGSGGREV